MKKMKEREKKMKKVKGKKKNPPSFIEISSIPHFD